MLEQIGGSSDAVGIQYQTDGMRGQSEIASEFPTKNANTSANPEKKVIALLKVRIKMQCCFKCRRGT